MFRLAKEQPCTYEYLEPCRRAVFLAATGFVTSPGGNYTYQTVMNVTDMDRIVFTVRGVRDARILLSSDDASEPIEIVIGGSYNPANGSSVSLIRWGVQSTSSATLERPSWIGATYTESGILSPDEDRFFVIHWWEYGVVVGKV
jgi:hypothetical protein